MTNHKGGNTMKRDNTILLAALIAAGASAGDPVPTPAGQAAAEWKEFRCGSPAKHHCADMRDCDEATFHWAMCGHASLDGDKDNMPCETVCPKVCGGE
jgi:hypothetical protein